MKKLNVAIIGQGFMGRAHSNAYRQVNHFFETAFDLHVYPYWAPVLSYLEAQGAPAPDCPQTLALLERAIHADLSPLLDEQDVDEIALAFEKVARGILA